jgi:quinol-cytochrome oxidoreductase complex cytochrome b subunit
MTDKRKGWFLIGISLIGYLIVWVLIRDRLSLLYGITTIPLIWGRILLTTESSERRARPVFKVIGIILVVLFIGITVIGSIIEIISFTR